MEFQLQPTSSNAQSTSHLPRLQEEQAALSLLSLSRPKQVRFSRTDEICDLRRSPPLRPSLLLRRRLQNSGHPSRRPPSSHPPAQSLLAEEARQAPELHPPFLGFPPAALPELPSIYTGNSTGPSQESSFSGRAPRSPSTVDPASLNTSSNNFNPYLSVYGQTPLRSPQPHTPFIFYLPTLINGRLYLVPYQYITTPPAQLPAPAFSTAHLNYIYRQPDPPQPSSSSRRQAGDL